MPLRVSRISIKTNGSEEAIELKNVTILVGPSNSGKSELLRNISEWLRKPLLESRMTILSKITDIELPTAEEIDNFISDLGSGDINEESTISVPVINYEYKDKSDPPRELVIKRTEFKNSIMKGFPYFRKKIDGLSWNDSELNRFSRFLEINSLRLDAETRFSLVEDQPMGDLLERPLNYLVKLYHDDIARDKISKIMKDEFGYYLYLIPYKGNIKILFNTEYLENPKNLSEENIKFFRNSKSILDISDGTRAFLGITLAVNSLPHKIVLIDDPEAFLHPPLAKSLGRYLSRPAVKKNSSLLVATHSVDFLMGCLDETKEITIIRLTYDKSRGTALKIPYDQIKNIMNTPLLRSNNVLDALFHKSAIVVEGNSDRIFYSEINLKMLDIKREKAIIDTIFLNAGGKHVIHQIVLPLKQINIPVVTIYDFDILDRSEDEHLFKNLLIVNQITREKIEKFIDLQQQIQRFVTNSIADGKPDPYKIGTGISYFPNDLGYKVTTMIDELKQSGIFIFSNGSLEKWLPMYGIVGEKKKWVLKILDKIVNVSVIPDDDVWKFMQEIRLYIEKQLIMEVD